MVLRQSSTTSPKKSILVSPRQSIPEVVIPVEHDVDERVTRSSTAYLQKAERPVSVSVENSKVFEVLQSDFPLELSQDLIWPDFSVLTPGECVEFLGDALGCRNHDENLASFWILDTLSELIRQGQVASLPDHHLCSMCLWFTHAIKTISVYAPSREEFFQELNRMLVLAEDEFLETGLLLKPEEALIKLNAETSNTAKEMLSGRLSLSDMVPQTDVIFVNSESSSQTSQKTEEIVSSSDADEDRGDAQPNRTSLKEGSGTSCGEMGSIQFLTQQMFNIFGNRFKYEVIKSVFSSAPEILPLVIVENLNFPKELGLSQKYIQEINQKRREGRGKGGGKTSTTMAKGGKAPTGMAKGGKKTEIEKEVTELALDKFRNQLEHLDWARLDEKEKRRTQDIYIKPLDDSLDTRFFERLFPRRETSVPVLQNIKDKQDNNGKNKKKK